MTAAFDPCDGVPQCALRLAQRFPGLWDDLRGAQLFVTGGSGFIGAWLLKTLAQANERFELDLRVSVLSRDPALAAARIPALAELSAFRFIAGDVRDFAFPDGHYSHVLHLAAIPAWDTFHRADPLEQFDIAYQGTRRVLEFAARCGAQRFLMTSSGSVYGAPTQGMELTPESYLGAPLPNDLGSAPEHGKRAAEFLTSYYQQKHGLETTIARCFTFIGPALPLDIHYAVGNFIRDALWQDELVIKGDGSPIRSYLHVADSLVWLLVMLTQAASGSVFNVGSDQPVSILDLATRIRDMLAPDKPIHVLGQQRGSANRNIYVPDIAQAREALRLDVWTPLDEAIRNTADYTKATRKGLLSQRG